MSDDMKNKETAVPEKTIILPPDGSLLLSTSPHVQDKHSIPEIMLKVMLCLLPAVIASLIVFGWNALRVILLCLIFCNLFEYLWTKLMKLELTLKDFSASVTGLILAMNLPASVPWWVCAVGAFIAIIIAKAIFGGLGQNPFNPAAVARVALLVGFAGPMASFPSARYAVALTSATPHAAASQPVLTSATPLSMVASCVGNEESIKALQTTEKLWSYFWGNVGGSLGETSAFALLLGGIGLIAFRLIRWQIPLAMLGTTFIFTWIVNLAAPSLTPGPLFHVLTGGMMIGAFFMATDMVTSPITKIGTLIYGGMIGLTACVIRIWGSYPEGVSFAIVIMNALVPLIDKFCYIRPFGWTSTSASALQMRRGEIK